MKIPKYIEKLLYRKMKLAKELNYVEVKLDNWLEAQGIDVYNEEVRDYLITGCMIYTEPETCYYHMRDYLEKWENK